MSTKEEKQKKWENYWYYYKWHTIVGIVALLVIAYTVYDKFFDLWLKKQRS